MTWQLGGWFWVIFGATYLLYFSEFCCCSSSREYLKNVHDGEGILDYIDRLQKAPPVYWMHVKCWNTTNEDKITHQVKAKYKFKSWRDVSISTDGLDECKLTKLTLSKQITFANEETRKHLRWVEKNLKENNDRDEKQTFESWLEIEGFEEKILVENVPGSRGCISHESFLFFSCLGCTTCFRTYFTCRSGRKEYLFRKEISI